MKGQITRHEWEGTFFRKICPHCKTEMARAHLQSSKTYYQEGKYPTSIEPKCVTRKKPDE